MQIKRGLLLVMLATSSNALAQSERDVGAYYTNDYRACMARVDRRNLPYVEVRICTNRELDLQDALLNQVYKQKMTSLSPARKAQLRVSQRAWIVRRDNYCENSDGNGYEGDPGFCYLDETIYRRIWLQRYR